MGVAKAIPSLGALTPIESMLKGGSSKVLNPMSLVDDTKTILSKPSAVINRQTFTGRGDGSAQTFTEQRKTAEATRAEEGRKAWFGVYGDATSFRNRVDANGGVSTAGPSNVGLAI